MSMETPTTLQPMLRKLLVWSPLTPPEQNAVLALPYKLQRYDAGKYIVREGDKPSHSCLLLSGFAYRQKIVGGGGRQIFSLHIAGDLVDLQNSFLGTADHNVQALTRVEVAYIPVQAVHDLAFSHPAIGYALWYDSLVDGAIFREWIANVGRRDARSRIAHLLCEFAVRLEAAGLGEQCDYELPMTQEQLADCTGLTPVHVNRTLRALDKEGLITRSKRAVKIPDWEKLQYAADFEPSYLHLSEHRLAA